MHRDDRLHRSTVCRQLRAALALATLAATLGGAGVALAACGAGSPSGTAAGSTVAGSTDPALIATSHCMRSHGIKQFPDPIQTSGGQAMPLAETSSGTTVVEGITFSGPAFQAAAKACRLGPGNRAGGGIPEGQKEKMLANAHCMRTHGVPSFPDPKFGPQGGVLVPDAGINPDSPAFQRANRECENVGTPLPGGG